MDDKIFDQFVSILIGPRYNYIYVSPNLVDKCGLIKEVQEESWLVQLATGTKKRVHHWVRSCAFYLNGIPTSTHLHVIPLGSYNILLGMNLCFHWDHIVFFWVWTGYIFVGTRWIFMTRLLSAWMKMMNT